MLLPLDVSSAEQIQAAVDRVVAELDRVHYLVNAAGIDYTLSVEELTIEQYDRILGVNLRGPFLLMKAVFPVMRRGGGGHIVNIASTAAIRTWANASAYTASKFGLVGLTRAIGVEGRPHNIKATTVFPGGMATNFFDRPDLEIKPDPTHLNDPSNVAEVIAYILEQPARSVVQEVLVTPLTETSWP
jgi:NAD(P)-dependent dehydrogenase (short-subunit alcohol dehydrogenase family)